MNRKILVLIVDDHHGMCSTLKDILESEGHKIIMVTSGQAAIELCKEQRFDVILMDIHMPDLNGVETFMRIKDYTKETRVIMMSAFSVDELKQKALKAGAIAFLQKPLDIDKTLQLIQWKEYPPALVVMEDKKEREKKIAKLNEQNYRVFTADTGEEALSLASQIRFNLIMIDGRLHSMSSLEMYLAFKKVTPTSVTIMLSENDKNFLQQAKDAVKQNAYSFLEKPLEPDKLLSILENHKRQQISYLLEKLGESHERNKRC